MSAFFFFFFGLVMLLEEGEYAQAQRMKLNMRHRHFVYDSLGLRFPSRRAALADLIAHDGARISARRRLSAGAPPPLASSPAPSPASPDTEIDVSLTSAAKLGTALYYVEISVGTPPQQVMLVADTGSDLVWVNCESASGSVFPSYSADNSSSVSYVECFSGECAGVSPNLECVYRPRRACKFTYSYIGGKSIRGVYMRDTVRLTSPTIDNDTVVLPGISMGCATSISGMDAVSSGGVLGLGQASYSFPAQTKRLFGAAFSYCLGDYLAPTTAKSELVFGRQSEKNFSYTPLLSAPNSTFYYVGVERVAVAGNALAVPVQNLRVDSHGNGGVIIDSGTSLTYLENETYGVVMESLRTTVSYPTAKTNDPTGFELCFNVSAVDGDPEFPDMNLTLQGGVELRVPAENYFLSIEDGVRCVGIMSIEWPSPSIIGALLHQNFLVEYDVELSRLGFAAQRC